MAVYNKRNNCKTSDIAVIGMSGRFPGAENTEEFWKNLVQGKETISFFSNKELREAGIQPSEYKNPRYVKAKGIIKNTDQFDADFFGYPPKEAEKMDPQFRLLHECCWEALEKAGYVPESCPDIIGLYLGANENQEWLRRVVAQTSNATEFYDAFVLNQRDYIATRISYKLDLKGPSFTLLSACSTSLVAVHLACQGIRNGSCSMALAGGVSLSYPSKSGYLHQEGFMVSSDGHCRSFDAQADGTVFGDGAGVVVLKPLKKALEDKDTVYAIIKGSAINNDGNGKAGFTAPSQEGQARVIRAALKQAGFQPDSITYIETHGTGTLLGDPIEFEALKQVFGSSNEHTCFLGSVKTNVGHLNIAAGIVAFIKTVLCLYHKTIPPTLHFTRSNPHIDLESSPFNINTRLQKWSTGQYPRRAGVSAFGFGGTNAHLVLEEAPRQKSSKKLPSGNLFLLSAHTSRSLQTMARNLSRDLRENKNIDMLDAAYTLTMGRRHFSLRRALVCGNKQQALEKLREIGTPIKTDPAPEIVFMFPGQGAQHINMGRQLYETEPEFRQAVDYCSRILQPHLDLDIRKIMYPSEENQAQATEQIKQTRIAQPAVFVISYALTRLWKSWGIIPQAVIGHSVGECAAACVAGVLKVKESLAFLVRRGELMQELPPGGMLAVSLSEKNILRLLGEHVSLAAVNAPHLTVISGPRETLELIRKKLRQQGIASRYLSTSHAFHSSMMDRVLDSFTRICDSYILHDPRIPMMSTVTGDWIGKGEIISPDYWIKNIRNPVLFSPAMRKLLQENKKIFLEVGPGKTLTNLARLHVPRKKGNTVLSSLPHSGEKHKDDFFLLQTLGKLWETGMRPDWDSFYAPVKPRRIPLSTYAFDRQSFWLGSNIPMVLASHPQALLDRKIPDPADWFWIPSWKRSLIPYSVNHKKTIRICSLIFMDTCGLGSRIARKLRAEGQEVITLWQGKTFEIKGKDSYAVNPKKLADYNAFSKKLEKKKKIPAKIIHLWNVTSDKESGSKNPLTRADYFQNLGFFSLLYIAQSMGKVNIPQEVHLYVVSNHLQEVNGSETIIPEKAPLLGPVKVIPQEYPNVKCCSLDVEFDPEIPGGLNQVTDQLLAEIRADIPEVMVAYRGDQRWIQSYEKIRLEKNLRSRFSPQKGATYLITGGLGGMGLVMAKYLSRTEAVKLILTTRKSFPSRTKWETWIDNHRVRNPISQKIKKLKKMEEGGVRIRVVSADVTDRKKMKEELEKAEKLLGPIKGVIHAAGLPGEGIMQLKKPGAARKILTPKIQGTLILSELLRSHRLEFFILCSSVASVLGGIGLGDYCAANAFLDAFALQRQRRRNQNIISINWDMWGQVGMGLKTQMPQELKEWFERELRNGITSVEGVDAFRRIVGWSGYPNIVVSTRDLQARVDLWLRRGLIKQKEKALKENSRTKYSRPHLTTEYTRPATEVEEKVARIWGNLFGIDKVGRTDNFYELGGHSLLATTLLSELRKIFGSSISIRDVMDNPTVSELSLLIEKYQKSNQSHTHGNA